MPIHPACWSSPSGPSSSSTLRAPNRRRRTRHSRTVKEPAVPGGEPGPEGTPSDPPATRQPKRFHGTVSLDATRVGRDASQIADEVIAHLAGLVGAKVTVTLEVAAEIPDGAPDHVVRTVTENSRTLKFTSQGFEKE